MIENYLFFLKMKVFRSQPDDHRHQKNEKSSKTTQNDKNKSKHLQPHVKSQHLLRGHARYPLRAHKTYEHAGEVLIFRSKTDQFAWVLEH